jgi:hypothetical protein
MNESDFRNDFSEYTDPDGFLSGERRPGFHSSGNLLLYTSHYFWALYRCGYLRERDVALIEGAVSRTQLEPGLHQRQAKRVPGEADEEIQQGPDDYIGIISMCAVVPWLPFAARFLHYGRTHRVPIRGALQAAGRTWLAALFGWIRLRFVYNNLIRDTLLRWENVPGSRVARPNWSAWLGRMPYIIAHAEYATGAKPALFYRLWWAASVWLAGRFSESNDAWILKWHMVATYRERGRRTWLCDWAARDFQARLFAAWPAGLNTVFARYFGPQHPLVRYFLS